MAVKDDGAFYPTDAIVSKTARKHYRVPVRSQHWQLRSLISAEKKHLVYFPGGHGSYHVQCLNTETRQCTTIRLLTFAPRCLVAENGWLCCGGEHGEFAAIKLDGENDDSGSDSSSASLDAEAPPPPGSDAPLSRDDTILSIFAQAARRSNKSLVAKSMKLAKERVNCITLWFPRTDAPAAEAAYTEPIAVLANNDRTVTLVSLQDFDQNDKIDPLDVVQYPDFVNRAIISPDGRLMIAILDDPYLYIHQRVKVPSESQSAPEYRWELKQRLMLKSQRKDDKTDSRGSFAACFSASGAYLAVGTQHGTVSVFDTTHLTNDSVDPLITTFASSRPESGPGAIRDMAFCPGPYDILAWTEDQGHIGLADMRSNFAIRQIVDISVEADFQNINILDRGTIDPRLLESRTARRENTQGSTSANTYSAPRREGDGLETLNHPLTTSEMRVLEALRGDRRRRERTGQPNGEGGTRDTPDLSVSSLSNVRPSATEGEASRARERSSSVSRAIGDLVGTYRDQRERAQERVRNARQNLLDTGDRQQGIRRPPERRWLQRLQETVATYDQLDQERQNSPYSTLLEFLQARERASTGADADETSLLAPLVNQVVNRWEESAIRGTLVSSDHSGVLGGAPLPDNTAGLAWSQDGCILYVGAQNGIYELHINLQGRKFCPSITWR